MMKTLYGSQDVHKVVITHMLMDLKFLNQMIVVLIGSIYQHQH